MAITHSIAHSYPGPPSPPGKMLDFLNAKLCERYTPDTATFVTAFYGVFNPARRTLRYACAGHNPPRLRRGRDVLSLNQAAGLPLGIIAEEVYEEATQALEAEDQIVFYTDGITETFSPDGDMFGAARLEEVMRECAGARPKWWIAWWRRCGHLEAVKPPTMTRRCWRPGCCDGVTPWAGRK